MTLTLAESLTMTGAVIAFMCVVVIPFVVSILNRLTRLESWQKSHSEADDARFNELRGSIDELKQELAIANASLSEIQGGLQEVRGFLKGRTGHE